MKHYQFNQLRYFALEELDVHGNQIHWEDYDFHTLQEFDRLRHEIGSPCRLIRGGVDHDPETLNKLTAIDAVFPGADYCVVIMALFRSGFSKGVYENGSVHLDDRMGPGGLARCWMAFKEERRQHIASMNLLELRSYNTDGWDYYHWSHPWAWDLLQYMVTLNKAKPQKKKKPTSVLT